MEPKLAAWEKSFDERQWRLIMNCRLYAEHDPAGLPGHNLMMIIAQMANQLDEADKLRREVAKNGE